LKAFRRSKRFQKAIKQKTPTVEVRVLSLIIKSAATYFPRYYPSIICADGLNFSVRNGKRWTPSP
jgi:hypothetical protein